MVLVIIDVAGVKNKILTCCQMCRACWRQYPRTGRLVVIVGAELGAGVGILDTGAGGPQEIEVL